MQERPVRSGPAGGKEGDALGDPLRVFCAKVATRLVVAFCGLILLGAGVALIIWTGTLGPGPWVLPFGILVLGLAYVMGQASYHVYTGGVASVRFGHRESCRWEELSEIKEVRIKQGAVSSRRCDLVRKDGLRMPLRDLGIGDFSGMLALIRQQAESRGIPWTREERSGK